MSSPTHRLTRSRRDRMIGGVAAGLAEYFDLDPTLVRLVFIIAAFLHGIGVLLYLALCIIVPSEAQEQATSAPPRNPTEGSETTMPDPIVIDQDEGPRPSREHRHALAGVILILVGLVFLAQNLGLLWWWQWRLVWPVVLIVIGGWLLLRRMRS